METIIRFIQDGGMFMYPIGIVLAIGLGIAVERWLFLMSAKSANQKAFDLMLPYIKKGQFAQLIKIAEASKAPVARIVGLGAQRVHGEIDRDEVANAMEEGVMEALPRIEKRTQFLATLANIATLLGLLGTIIGLIAAFTAVANADPSEKASLLSASISVAMNTTAFGLIAAIPLLVLHSFLQGKTTELTDSLDMAGVKFLNNIQK
jgi:biopolymer transport protein ExbB/TolQ